MSEKEVLNRFLKEVGGDYHERAPVEGVWNFKITRADGSVEEHEARNTLTAAGLNHLAQLAISNTDSAFAYIAIGTQTAASSLGSVQADMGEVDRKIGATITSSKEYMVLISTWAGNADTLTSVDLRTACICNHASSGQGVHLNFVNSVATILADSDFLNVTARVRIGSHNL